MLFPLPVRRAGCDSAEIVSFEIKERLNSCGEKKEKGIQQIFPQNNKCLGLYIKKPSRRLSLEIPSNTLLLFKEGLKEANADGVQSREASVCPSRGC